MGKLPRGLRNNNPGNIRISGTKYVGEVQPSQDKAFKQFETMSYGYRAMFVLLHTYQKKHGLNTVREMISRYAPPVENNTGGYVGRVEKDSGIDAYEAVDTLKGDAMIPVVAAMSAVENGVQANMDDVRCGWDLFVSLNANHV